MNMKETVTVQKITMEQDFTNEERYPVIRVEGPMGKFTYVPWPKGWPSLEHLAGHIRDTLARHPQIFWDLSVVENPAKVEIVWDGKPRRVN